MKNKTNNEKPDTQLNTRPTMKNKSNNEKQQ